MPSGVHLPVDDCCYTEGERALPQENQEEMLDDNAQENGEISVEE